MNADNRKVAVAIEDIGNLKLDHPSFKQLENMGATIITDINQIKTLF